MRVCVQRVCVSVENIGYVLYSKWEVHLFTDMVLTKLDTSI